ncbi:MAG: hypothetical protein H6719_07150 [Sandaracinaceae bacterium]|nr:hypothetical protein [Sandaracinaceae bacterium]
MTVAGRQALLAQFLDDPELEERVRAEPEAVARERGLEPSYVEWLAGLEPRRVRSFRISRRVKADRRG